MNIDPNKVKQLILIFSELDDKYQEKLLAEALKLQLMQAQKNKIQREGKTYKPEIQLQEEIKRRTNEEAKDALKLIDIFKQVDDTDKAALFMLLKRLSGKPDSIQESDISITINQKSVSMKEYLEKYLSNADYDKAKKTVDEFMEGKNR